MNVLKHRFLNFIEWRGLALPSFSYLMATLFSCLFFVFYFSNQLLLDGDTLFHIRTGEYLLKLQHLPYYDFFSNFQAPVKWSSHAWLTEVIMFLDYRYFGLHGIVFFFSFVIAVTYAGLFSYTQSEHFFSSVIAILFTTMTAAVHFFARPHLITYALIAYYVVNLDRSQFNKPNFVWSFPIISILWVNLHGGFVVGVILIGAYAGAFFLEGILGQDPSKICKGRYLSFIFMLSLALCLFNPSGAQGLFHPFKIATADFYFKYITEFQALNIHEMPAFKWHLVCLLMVLFLSPRRLSLVESVLVVLGIYMALHSKRHVAIFAILTYPIFVRAIAAFLEWQHPIAKSLKGVSERLTEINNRKVFGRAWLLLFVLISGVAILFRQPIDLSKIGDKPVEATQFIQKEKPFGKMFNADEFGDYLIYILFPQYKVFIDSRSDMYGAKIFSDYLKICNISPVWADLLKKYKIDWVVFYTHSSLAGLLSHNADWHLIYSDSLASVFVRKIPQNERLIKQYSKVNLELKDGHQL